MNLPININDLLTARTVEWERLEFKAGWNPEEVIHSLCAFANDFHNLGGGYIVLGIEEKDGRPVLPPKGLRVNQIDKIQKEILGMGHKIQPFYHPIIVPCKYRRKNIIVLWSVGGQTRPYKAPVSLSKKNGMYRYYIRKGSSTVIAKQHDERELIEMASTVPFDDRIHHASTIDDLDLGLIRSYLKQVKSDLFDESAGMDFLRLCRQMNLVDGPDEFVRPKNVALMFFNNTPGAFFPQTQIDVVHFPEGPGADSFSEMIFKGPIHVMLQEVLTHIRNQVIAEKIIKHSDRPQADRFFNYPFVAVKEVLCNAVYHRSYEIREPIEVRILPDCITVGSFPGPDRSISDKDMDTFRFTSRRYRNRRVGEFLKELDMTEGRGTGIPKILREIKKNESPLPVFHTDKDRSFMTVEIPIHPAFLREDEEVVVTGTPQVTGEATGEVTGEVAGEVIEVLEALRFPLSRKALQEKLGLKGQANFRERYLEPVLDAELVEMTQPDSPKSPTQKYRLTEKGKKHLKSNEY